MQVVVDDLLPVNRVTGRLLFVTSDDKGEVRWAASLPCLQVWPCLVEKAYAKLQGSYANLVGGVGTIRTQGSNLLSFPRRPCSPSLGGSPRFTEALEVGGCWYRVDS